MSYRIVLRSIDGVDRTVKYWTGKMVGSWPEALKAPGRALAITTEAAASAAALQFNQRYGQQGTVEWEVEEIV